MKNMKNSKKKAITIKLSEDVLKNIDWLAPLEDMSREELIIKAINKFLKPHLSIRDGLSQIVRDMESGKEKVFGPFQTAEELIKSLKGKSKGSRK